MPQTYGRNILPLYPTPVHYDLAIEGEFKNFEFIGEVVVHLDLKRWQDEDFTCPSELKEITFNAAEIEILEASIDKIEGRRNSGCFSLQQPFELDLTRQTVDEPNERITLALPCPIAIRGEIEQRKSGEHRPQTRNGIYNEDDILLLRIKYKGCVNDQMRGFYRSAYTVKGERAFFGTTQFESCDCRRALPSWDEPLLKATFSVTLIVDDDGIMALSNTHEVSRKKLAANEGSGRLLTSAEEVAKPKLAVSFDKTPRMSTYLLAWTVGHFDFIEKKIRKTNASNEEVLIRIYAPEGKAQDGHFALDVAARTLPLYEQFFGSDYLLEKCDLIAIPDFAAGAMENWGLITYRETALLCNDESSVAAKQRVALVVAHELAHQWFGNLVTMQWWMELWLNESFATWTEYYAVDVLFPQWQIFADFVIVETAAAFKLDALRSSHPVEVDVKNAQEIDEIFDAISYCKGGSIVRMVAEHIGLDALSTGLKKYLKHFEFGNANTVDLWNFLGEAAGTPLSKLLRVWTSVQGYPLLKASHNDVDDTMTLSQSRFLADKPPTADTAETVWSLPLQFLIGKKDGSSSVLKPEVMTCAETCVPLGKDCEWAKANHMQTCFCRVHYDNKTLTKLTTAIEGGHMKNTFDRLGLVNDYHALAKGGYIPFSEAIALLKSFASKECDYVVWAAISGFESDIRTMILRSPASGVIDSFNKFCRELYSPALARVTPQFVDGGDAREAQLRALLLSRLCAADDQQSISTVMKFWEQRSERSIPADVIMTTYSVAVKHGGAEAFEQVKGICNSTDATIRSWALKALGSATNEAMLQSVVDLVFSGTVRSQDVIYPLSAIAGNKFGTPIYLNLLNTRWDEVCKKLPGMIIGSLVKCVSNFITSDPEIIIKIESWWESVPEVSRQSLERTYRQGIEELKNGLAWATRDGKAVVENFATQPV